MQEAVEDRKFSLATTEVANDYKPPHLKKAEQTLEIMKVVLNYLDRKGLIIPGRASVEANGPVS
jgi:hypothetical protein